MTANLIDSHITAEDAPLNVQLWPTRSAEYAPNFTLASVDIKVDLMDRKFVRWTYQNGNTRDFNLGEQVFCRVTA